MRVLGFLAVVLVGCEGRIMTPGARPQVNGVDPAGGTPAPAGFACAPSQQPRATPRPLRRLTSFELMATWQQLLGDDVLASLGPLTALHPVDGPTTVSPGFSATLTQSLFALADAASTRVATDARAAQAVGLDEPCFASGSPTCLRAFVEHFGGLAWRRPLARAEVDDALALTSSEVSASENIKRLVMAVLLDPEHLTLLEVGDDSPNEFNEVRLTPYEFANRLAFSVTGAMPDDALRAAAQSGALDDPNEVVAQVKRLTQTPGARAQLDRLVRAWLPLNAKAGYPDDLPVSYFGAQLELGDPAARYTHTQALRDDATDFVAGILRDSRSWRDLMSAAVAYPSNETARQVYQLPGAVGAGAVSVPHAGLGQRPYFLLNANGNSNAIYRGQFVLTNLLCRQLGPPPDTSLIAAAPEGDPVFVNSRSLVETKTASPVCQGCHSQFNAFGYALESFDGLGRWRTEESFTLTSAVFDYRTQCDPSDGHTVGHDDPKSEHYCPNVRPPYRHALALNVAPTLDPEVGPVPVTSSAEFAQALAASSAVASCFSQVVHRTLTLTTEGEAYGCELEQTRGRALDASVPLRDTLFGELWSARSRSRLVTP